MCAIVRRIDRDVLVLDAELGAWIVEVHADEPGPVVGARDERRLSRDMESLCAHVAGTKASSQHTFFSSMVSGCSRRS